MMVVVVTGTVGTGKSTVAHAFTQMRIPPLPLWDADAFVAGIYRPGGEAVDLVSERFPEARTSEGGIDAKILQKSLQGRPKEWEKLEKLVHPLVRLSMHRFLEENLKKDPEICILDIPLLYEGKLESIADCVVVITAQDDIVLKRLANRGGRSMDEKRLAEIRKRQWPSREKEARADFIIHNNSTKEYIKQRVSNILKSLGITF